MVKLECGLEYDLHKTPGGKLSFKVFQLPLAWRNLSLEDFREKRQSSRFGIVDTSVGVRVSIANHGTLIIGVSNIEMGRRYYDYGREYYYPRSWETAESAMLKFETALRELNDSFANMRNFFTD